MAIRDRLADAPEKERTPRYKKILDLPPTTYLKFLPENLVFQKKQIVWTEQMDATSDYRAPWVFTVRSKDGMQTRDLEISLIRLESDGFKCSLMRKDN